MDSRAGYVKRAGRYVAYSAVGSGPIDVLYVSTSTISIDALDEEPHVARYFQRLAGFARLIRFDVRGVGGSDPLDSAQPPTVEETARDARAVIEAECEDSVVVIADAGGGLVAIELAATWPSPARAVTCALAIARRAGSIGLDVRSGVHTGEVQRQGDDIAGVAVHIGARVAALAGSGEVLATRTVRDLTTGSRLRFADRGEHTLKGVPDPWQLYAVDA